VLKAKVFSYLQRLQLNEYAPGKTATDAGCYNSLARRGRILAFIV
jgi:hypothetical protein